MFAEASFLVAMMSEQRITQFNSLCAPQKSAESRAKTRIIAYDDDVEGRGA